MTRELPQFEFATRAAEIAREGGALLMEYFKKRVVIEYKGEADLVTEADRACERLLMERLRKQWPEHDIAAEEGGRQSSGSSYRWHVDPLDGTTNFAHGFPVFCVSLGLEKDGELMAGVIYDPWRDEMFQAERNRGAYLNGERIRVSKTARLGESLLATGFPSKKRHKNPNIFFYHVLTLRSHGLRRAGSAALDLAYVACGRFDGFWEFNLNPWDTAAGVLLVREAGGTVSKFSGAEFELNSREVLASNGLIHEEMVRVFAEIFAQRNLEELPAPADWKK
jgi:myo-inositol-1(or 4)-monophosphatase